MKRIFITILIILQLSSCGVQNMQRRPSPNFEVSVKSNKIDKKSLEYQMYEAVHIKNDSDRYKKMKFLLENGADANRMSGKIKWVETNPLWSCCENPKLAELLISYGADVKKRPYVASLISYINLADKNPREDRKMFYEKHPLVPIIYEHEMYESVKILLRSGADPNFKCIYGEKSLFPATDWNYKRYFSKHGKTAINYCVEGNFLSLFSLLIDYGAKLDKESIRLSKETTAQTGSFEMEELVKLHWKLQNEK